MRTLGGPPCELWFLYVLQTRGARSVCQDNAGGPACLAVCGWFVGANMRLRPEVEVS